ncbi:hypothetical protein BDA99DRAFT_536570 [Phascolomyces articulosus]|uniref:Protein UNC80 C-terminal domain-containing protein n=1 Tax=Phascolomyces articulosus TaxID=60185 RepID=A0AAD5KC54_9FUNG|nr:hypothetical protein BDA99DRAFT_536570 [Phascolomyces articulosus]
MSNEHNGNGASPPQPPSVFVSQPKLLPPLRNASLHHRNNQQSKKDSDPSRPSMPATATAAAVAVRLGRGHNLFLRNQPSTSSNYSSSTNSYSTTQPTSITPSITTNGYHTPSNGSGGGYHRQHLRARGGIYATTTTAQQDIVRLERDLEKLLLRPHGRHRQAGLSTGIHNTLDPHQNNHNGNGNNINDHHQENGNRRNLFMRYSKADLMGGGSHHDILNEDVRTDQTRIAAIMGSILEVVERHKLATQLPFAGDILGVLSVPFSQSPVNVNDCQQALDIFDYIRERFKQLDPIDNFEQIMFCCRLLKLGQLKLKMRLVATLKLMLAPCMGNPNFLPSSFAAFHALVYTLVDAFSSASSSLANTILERPYSRHEEEFDHIQSSIFDLLDKLASGNIIPLVGVEWDRYFIIPQHHVIEDVNDEHADDNNKVDQSNDMIPVLVARYCVVEALCRSLMPNTHSNKLDSASKAAIGKLIIEKFLPRYWQEPDTQLEPAYTIVLYVLSECATDWFINATNEELRQPSSSVSLLLNFVQEKLTASSLQTYLPDWHDNMNQRSVYINTISMILSILSVTSLKDPQPNSLRSSPNHSPRPSSAYNMDSATWPPPPSPSFEDSIRDQLSTKSGTDNKSDFFAWRHTVSTFKSYFETFWNSPLNDLVIQVITDIINDGTWEQVTQMYENLAFNMINDENHTIGEKIVHATLSTFLDRLVSTYPTPTPALSQLLYRLSQTYRTVFYRPVITCAASDDEHKIATQLTMITCLRKYLSGVQFWMQDAEMINVVLLSDLGSKKAAKEKAALDAEIALMKWGSTTLGQCVIAMEFMWSIKELREKQSDTNRNMEEDEIAKKFLIDLERRLAVFMTAKEKLVLIPIPLRVILCNIFLDARFFCNTTHRPGWLSRAIDWATQPVATAEFFRDTNHNNNNNNDDDIDEVETNSPSSTPDDRKAAAAAARTSAILHHHYLDDVTLMFQRIRITYAMTVDQLENETNEVLEYGDRPVSTLPRPSPASHTTPLSTANTTTASSSPMEDLIDTLVTTAIIDESSSFPVHTKRRQCMADMYPISRAAAASLDLNPPRPSNTVLASKFAKKRLEDMPSVHQDPFGAVFSLLVAVFTSLTTHEFGRLVHPLWERYIDDRNPRAFVPAAFLLMQCAEKVPKNVVEAFTHDFYSSDPFRRLSAVEKQAALAGYRFNILAQEYIPTSSRKRPFRGDGGAFSTPFVPTDLGSNRFTMDEPRWMAKLKHASNFPIELKRQIQELGWDDDDQGEEHEALKKVLTPLALLPSFYLEEEDEPNEGGDGTGLGGGRGGGENETRHVNVSKIIARRKRAATVHALTSANLSMVDLLGDDFGGVSSALRELLEMFLRDDPALFLRPFLGDLGKSKINHQRELLTRLRYLVDLRSKLPPGFSYILFNYLAGMLKWLTRENKEDGLVLMTLIHPILAELALSTNELSTRDLRKSKIEHLLASTGRFWFTNEQPASMFPRGLTDTRTPFSILDVPWDIFSVAMLRISHIQFLTNFLARYPREVYAVKKTLQDYEPLIAFLPYGGPNGSTSRKKKRSSFQPGAPDTYFPDINLRKRRDTTFVFEEEEQQANTKLDILKPVPRISQQEEDVGLLSALRARVWLRFIDTLLIGLNKNYNDRNELERILKGVNMIIMEHNMDFEIIGQALILYTRVVTKFKRLFLGSRGHGIFLPALFKVFCEVERFSHVRSAITFAWCRFYAVHEETFVFQMLGALVPVILNAYDKSTSLGAWMTDNLFTLMQSMHNPPRLGATSDVLGLQLQVELDDHERSVQERIDAVSNPMAMPLSTTILKPLARSVTAPIVPLVVSDYDNRPFLLQNFVKLFLTIIAYDPGSLRAEQFVKMMRHMLPRFCVLGNLTSLVSEGIAALIEVFAKFSKNAKPAAATANTSGHTGAPHINITIPHFFEDRNNNTNAGQGASGGYDTSGMGSGAHGNSSNNNTGNNTSRPESTQHAYGKQWQQNDRLTIKKEFVLLVNEFLKCHGVLTETNHEKMANIIRIIMRDYASIRGAICPTDWIKSYLVDALQSMVDMRNYTKSFKTMLLQIYAQLRTQWKTVELADVYEGFAIILENGQGKAINMNDIAGLMMDKFVSFGLSIATRLSDWESGQEAHTKFCNVLVRLIVAIMENSTQDVLREIEQLQPSVLLIGKIIIPMCLQYDLRWDYSSISVIRRYRPEPTANWMRLMAYISKCCSQASLLKSKSSGFSLSALTSNIGQTTSGSSGGGSGPHDGVGGASGAAADMGEVLSDPKDKKQQTPTAIAHLFSLSIVAMKVILLRGAKSLDKVRGSWVQVAYFLKGALIFGQTLKTLKPRSGRSTPRMPLSPGLSPPSAFPPPSPITPDSNHTSFLQNNNSTANGTNTNSNVPLSTAILYDYATWCFLEFVICYKSPLKLFLRSFLDEKLNEMGSRVSPSGSRSNSMLNSPSSMGSRRSNRWKSWGHNDTGGESSEDHQQQQQQQPDSSPTCGLGLHIPNNNPPPASPSLSVHPPSIDSSLANEAAGGSPRSPRSPSYQRGSSSQRKRRPTSGGNPASTELHVIHAETITALMNIQNALGYRTTLPWGTDHLQNHTQQQSIPWTYRAAVSKVSYEWRLIMQLYSQLVDASMISSSNKLPTTPTTTS